MWFKIVVLAVILAVVLNRPLKVVRGQFMDTSKETAAKIQPGMTLEEVEQLIGGPPGDYVLTQKRTQFIRGANNNPNTISWVTYQGEIEVTDGYTGLHAYQKPDGMVDSVIWKPPYDRATDDGLSRGTVLKVAAVLGAIFLFVVGRNLFRVVRNRYRPTASDPPAPDHADGGASASEKP